MSKTELIQDLVRLGQEQLLDAPTIGELGTSVRAMLQDAANACQVNAWGRVEASCRACGEVSKMPPAYRGSMPIKLIEGISKYFIGVSLIGQDHYQEGLKIFSENADHLAFSSPRCSGAIWLAAARVHREIISGDLRDTALVTEDNSVEPLYEGLWSLQRSENLLRELRESTAKGLKEQVEMEHARYMILWKTNTPVT